MIASLEERGETGIVSKELEVWDYALKLV